MRLFLSNPRYRRGAAGYKIVSPKPRRRRTKTSGVILYCDFLNSPTIIRWSFLSYIKVGRRKVRKIFQIGLVCAIAILSPLFVIAPLSANCVHCQSRTGGWRPNCGGTGCNCGNSWCSGHGPGACSPGGNCNRESRICTNGCGSWESTRTRSVTVSFPGCNRSGWSGWSRDCPVQGDWLGPNPHAVWGNVSGGWIRRVCNAATETQTYTYANTGERRDPGTGDMIYSLCGAISCR